MPELIPAAAARVAPGSSGVARPIDLPLTPNSAEGISPAFLVPGAGVCPAFNIAPEEAMEQSAQQQAGPTSAQKRYAISEMSPSKRSSSRQSSSPLPAEHNDGSRSISAEGKSHSALVIHCAPGCRFCMSGYSTHKKPVMGFLSVKIIVVVLEGSTDAKMTNYWWQLVILQSYSLRLVNLENDWDRGFFIGTKFVSCHQIFSQM